MRTRTVIIFLLLFIYAGISAKRRPVSVIIIAGQSNTDGRVNNEELPDYIKQHGYRHCWWSYGSDTISGGGRFERFWPRVAKPDNKDRWGYDAVVYSLKSRDRSELVVKSLHRLAEEDPNFHVVDIEDATIQRDRLHFDSKGAELLGQRIYKRLTEVTGGIR